MIKSDAMVLRISVDNTQAKREMGEFADATTKTARATERSGERIERANKKAALSVNNLRLSMAKIGIAIGAITGATLAIDKLAKRADEIDSLGRAFDTLT